MNVKMKLKLTHKIKNGTETWADYSLNWTLKTFTIFRLGFDSGTSYTKDLKYDRVAASTKDFEIYKDFDGKLVRKKISDGTYATYETGDFVGICGIDNKYVYLLKKQGEAFDIYRVTIKGIPNKNLVIPKDKEDKVIATGVYEVLTEAGEYLYYVELAQKDTVMRVSRGDLSKSKFCTFENMEYVIFKEDGDNFYVATKDPGDVLRGFLGEYDTDYYNVNSNGTVTGEADGLFYEDVGYDYNVLVRYVDHNYLRSLATEVNIRSKNGNKVGMPTDRWMELYRKRCICN